MSIRTTYKNIVELLALLTVKRTVGILPIGQGNEHVTCTFPDTVCSAFCFVPSVALAMDEAVPYRPLEEGELTLENNASSFSIDAIVGVWLPISNLNKITVTSVGKSKAQGCQILYI